MIYTVLEKLNENITNVFENIEKAAIKSGRKANDIQLIAVTKTIDIDKMKYAQGIGLKNFGENRVQELVKKVDQFNGINWHLIGHLQRNKVRQIIDKVELIHSVDSEKLMKEINIQSSRKNKIMPILIQVNVAQEKSKFGIKIDEVEGFIEQATLYNNIIIKGLMTIAPFEENAELVRPIFSELKEKYDKIKKIEHKNIEFEYLSMGMTNDYIVAIEEGSNMVRIGSAIFGQRNL
ncbi:MAG TPA: YggS family pyridoxal phosphate-dependent enzyme [Eubacteriaceae bacterium]|jgi:pyridoxal phosphate enzyme (YggS family)|nr:YggS family pyridoxal phosphate-dependent enzyme [Eubacteriaceae bacterium]